VAQTLIARSDIVETNALHVPANSSTPSASLPLSIPDLLAAQAERTPDGVALLADDRTPLTYERLQRHVAETADTLSAMGLGHDDRLAVVLPPGPEMAATFIAVTACATCAPLNPAYSARDFDFYLSDLQAKALLVQAGADSPARAAAKARGLAIIELSPRRDSEAGLFTLAGTPRTASASRANARPDDVALILHTSGTTSRPKIVPLTHANVSASAENTRVALNLTPLDRILHILPLYHTYGLISTLLASLMAGASVVCTRGFSARAFFTWLAEFRPTWYAGVPSVHQAILARAAWQGEHLPDSPLRLIFSSAALLPDSTRAELERVFRAPVVDAYGMTEAAGQITCDPLPPRARKAHSVGMAAGPEIAIMHAGGTILHAGDIGEVVIRGANVVHGYDNDPGANASAFRHGWFRTGDQGFLDTDGYLFITGRLRELINRGGENIAPQEVDIVLLEHPAVAQAATFAVPDARLGEDIAAAVVLHRGAAATSEDIREFAAARLALFKVPRRVLIVEQIPSGPTGKVQRLGLADKLGLTLPVSAPPTAPTDRTAPRTPLEEMLVGIWTELFGIARVGIDDDFFAMGGDSLLVTQLFSRVLDATHVHLSFLTFFETPTIAGLARCIEAAGRPVATQSTPPLRPVHRAGPLPLSYAQHRLWFLEQLGLSPPPYNFLEVVRLRGALDIAALTQSLQDILIRHEVLRTVFVSVAGEPRQVVTPPATLPVPLLDLRDLAAPAQQAAVEAWARQEAQQPFDLARGPLIRVSLLRLAPEEHALCLVLHDIVCDGWSHGVFWKELATLYGAHLTAQSMPLPPLSVQYADFAHWQRQWLQGDVVESQLAYWTRQLAHASALQLHTDYPRPPRPTSQGAKQFFTLPPALTQALRVLSQRHGVTLFMVLLAAFQVLLHRYTRQDDIVVGSLIANRNRTELEDLLGFFTNTVILRTDLSGNPSFEELLQRVRHVTLGAFSHQDLPLEKLLEALQPRRDLSRNPLFQVLFVLHNAPHQTPRLSGLTVQTLAVDPGTARFDLALELSDTPDGLHGYFEYCTDLFAASTIARMAEHLRTVLASISTDSTQRLATVPLSTAEERQHLLAARNAIRRPYPVDQCLHQLFEAQAALTPDAVALACGDTRVTYADLNRRANQTAHYLQAAGVKPAGLVGLCVERSVEMVVGLLGILKAGGAYVPLDPSYPPERLAFMVTDADLPVILTQERLKASLPAHGAQVVCLDAHWPIIARSSDKNPVSGATADQVAYLLYTSGSTGQPKGVLGLHRAKVNALHWMWEAYPFALHEVCCHKTSINFADATQELLGPLLRGIPTVLIPGTVLRDLPRFVQTLATHRVTRTILVPSLLRVLLDTLPDLTHRLPDLTLWLCSGEILLSSLWQRFRERLPHCRLVNFYGASEMSDDVTWYEPDLAHHSRLSVPIGRPIPNMQVYLLDEQREPVPTGIPGELYVGGVGLTQGYLNRPALTAERFIPHPFSDEPGARVYRTGDLARYLPDGNLEFLGRVDDQVKLRGYRIEPREIELALEQHPAIRQAVVLAREETPGETFLAAYLVLDREPAPTTSALRRALQARLPDYMLPSTFVVVDRLPLTPSGKTDRRALPPPDRRRPLLAEGFLAPRNATETAVAAIWAQLLRLEQVGIHDNFFELGGHSLLAMQVLARVHAATRVNVPLLRFFETPTVAGVSAFIETFPANEPPLAPIRPALRRGLLPASSGQEHLWYLERMWPDASFSNLAYALRLGGPLDVQILQRSVDTLVARHETLRATFKLVDGRLVQVVASTLHIPITVVDLRSLPALVREAESRRLAQHEARQRFDLARGPLLRLRLWSLDVQEHVLLVLMHHIVGDRWSMGILLQELAASYAAHAAGNRPALPPLPIQYADFAHWQRQWHSQATLRRQLAYWKRQLRGPFRRLAFPTDRPRRQASIAHTAREPLAISPSLSQALTSLSHSEGGTVFMTVMAAFKILVHSYTGEEDVRVATFLANRARPETEGVIGLFADMAILRTNLSGNPTCREILQRVRRTTLEAYAHQEFPFEELVQILERERGVARATLSQVMLIWQPALRLPPRHAALPLTLLEMDQRELAPDAVLTTFDVILELREEPPGLSGSCLYNPAPFDAATIHRLLDDFRDVLDIIVARPEQPLETFRPSREDVRQRGGSST
jgi:amino acid adenylation domain-containing protein